VAKEVWRQLLEPFETEEAAKAFWQKAPSTFIVLESGDSLSQLENSEAWLAIEFAITCPEYTEVLSLGYRLTMAIFTYSGSGIYLPILSEVFLAILNRELEQLESLSGGETEIVCSFRDIHYSAEIGGYHPVEIPCVHIDRMREYSYMK